MPLINVDDPRKTANNLTDDDVRILLREAKSLLALQPALRIGVAMHVLLQESYEHPELLRVALSERVVRNGFTGESMISVLRRAAR